MCVFNVFWWFKFWQSKKSLRVKYFSSTITFRKYGLSILESFTTNGCHQFAWKLWYIWNGRNNKGFSNIYVDPMGTLNWQRQNLYFGQRHKLQSHKGLVHIGRERLLILLIYREDGVSSLDHGKTKRVIWSKGGTVR